MPPYFLVPHCCLGCGTHHAPLPPREVVRKREDGEVYGNGCKQQRLHLNTDEVTLDSCINHAP